MKNLKYYLKKTQKQGWAIGQFNFSTLEQLKGIIMAAENMRSPVILGTSEKESEFIGLRQARALISIYQKKGLPIFLNLDHSKSLSYIKKAIDEGYDAVHFDGSRLNLSENIKMTKKAIVLARKKNVLTEAEIGIIGSNSSKIYDRSFKIKQADLTKLENVEKFLKNVKIDSLGISIGNFHGVKTKGLNPHLDLSRLKKIKEKVRQERLNSKLKAKVLRTKLVKRKK